jgi:hypothetical protein
VTRTTQELADQAARWRKTAREAQGAAAALRKVIDEQNELLLRLYLQDRLADPSDFSAYVPTSEVIDATGRIAWARVQRLVDELLAKKPHLGATHVGDPFKKGPAAVEWFSSGSV